MPKPSKDPERSRRTKSPKHPNNTLKKVAVAAGAVAIIAGSVGVAKRVINPGEIVTSIIDGDTFTIANRQSIRFFGIDAPALEYCFGQEAKEALEKKILGKKVILKSPRTDYYKRVQAYVYLDGEFINEYMAKNGLVSDHGFGNEESEIINDANNYARDNKIGIYSEKCSPTKSDKKGCVIKGQVSYHGDGNTYTVPGCANYGQALVERFRGEDWFCTVGEAKSAGFIKKEPNCPK